MFLQIFNQRKLTKFTVVFLLLLTLPLLSLSAAESISVKGFGKLKVTKSDGEYALSLGKLGNFNFTGTLRPLKLSTTVERDQLEGFPGYRAFSRLGMQEATLSLAKSGLSMKARVSTKRNLETLCEFLRLDVPYIDISARVAPGSIALNGDLTPEEGPVEFTVNKKLGTKLMVDKVGIGLNVGRAFPKKRTNHQAASQAGQQQNRKKRARKKGKLTPVIKIYGEYKIQPTKEDPVLPIKLAMSYNLISQEISASGSMMGRWANPLGLSRIFDKDAIVLENTAISIGWIPGAPSPTKLGFYVEKAKFFHLDVGFAADLSPTAGQIALMVRVDELSMNDYMTMLEKGFGVNMLDGIPGDVAIKDFYLLFAPNGGEVGEFTIKDGLALKGNVTLTSMFKGKMDFSADFDDGISLYIALDTSKLYDKLENEIRKLKGVGPVLNQAVSTLQVQELAIFMTGKRSKFGGGTKVVLEVLNQDIKMQLKGYVNPDRLVKKIVGRIKSVAKKHGKKMLRKAGRFAKKAGKKGITAAKKAGGRVKDIAKKIGTTTRHLHKPEKCYKKCVPNYAKPLRKKLLKGANRAVRDFYSDVRVSLKKVDTGNRSKNRRIRRNIIRGSWKDLAKQLDEEWKDLYYDGGVIPFFIRKSKAEKGNRIFKKYIKAHWNKHKRYRKKYYRKMINIDPFPEKILAHDGPGITEAEFYLRVPGTDQYLDVSGSPFRKSGKSKSIKERRLKRRKLRKQRKTFSGPAVQIWHLKGKEKKETDRTVRFIPHQWDKHAFVIQFRRGGRKIIGVKGGENQHGSKVVMQHWRRKNHAWQRWYVKPHPEIKGSYLIISGMTGRAKAMDIKGGGDNIYKRGTDYIVWPMHKKRNQQLELVYASGPKKGKVYTGPATHDRAFGDTPLFFEKYEDKAFSFSTKRKGIRYEGSAYIGRLKRKHVYLVYRATGTDPESGEVQLLDGKIQLHYSRMEGTYSFRGLKGNPAIPYSKKERYQGQAFEKDKALVLERGKQSIKLEALNDSRYTVIASQPLFFQKNRDATFNVKAAAMGGGYEGTGKVLSIEDDTITMEWTYDIRGKTYNSKRKLYYMNGIYRMSKKKLSAGWGIATADSRKLDMPGSGVHRQISLPEKPAFFVENRDRSFTYKMTSQGGSVKGKATILSIKDKVITLEVKGVSRMGPKKKQTTFKKKLYYLGKGRYSNRKNAKAEHAETGKADANSSRLSLSGHASATVFVVR